MGQFTPALKAHPDFLLNGTAFYSSAEQCLVHITNVCNYLLIRPATQGKTILDEIFKQINQESFPIEEEKILNFFNSPSYKLKDNVKRSLIICLLKEILINEEPMSVKSAVKKVISIKVLSRIYSQIYSDIIKENISTFFSRTCERCLIRSFLLLEKCPEIWDFLFDDSKVRLETVCNILQFKHYIQMPIIKIAELFPVLTEKIMATFDSFSSDEKYKIVSSFPSFLFKDIAIRWFLESGSYSWSYSTGINHFLPHVQYFSKDDIALILKLVFENKRNKNFYNQILDAGNIGEVFLSFYSKSTEKFPDSIDLWVEFYQNLKEHKFSYLSSQLNEILKIDDIPNEEEYDFENDIPF